MTTPSGLFWSFLAVSHGSAQFSTWGTLLGPKQCRESKIGKIHLPNSKFQILLSIGLQVAFLVSEFKVQPFSNLLGPNDPKKAKKQKICDTIVALAFDLAFMTLMTFSGLFVSFCWSLMSNKSIRFIFC